MTVMNCQSTPTGVGSSHTIEPDARLSTFNDLVWLAGDGLVVLAYGFSER